MKKKNGTMPLPELGRSRVANLLGTTAVGFVLLAALSLFLLSLFFGARLRASVYAIASRVDLFQENAIVNIIAFCILFILVRLIGKIRISRNVNIIAGIVVLLMLTIGGIAWVWSISGIPSCDAGILYDVVLKMHGGENAAAELLEQGNMYRYYLVSYPFQFGYLSYMDLIYSIVGSGYFAAALRGASVLLIVGSYAAIMLLTQELFSDDRVTLVTILLLGLCIQPVLYAAACYSQIPSFTASVWGIYAMVRYFKHRKLRSLGFAVIALAVAVYIKPNAWIVIAALCIVLVLDAIREKRWRSLIAVVIIVACALPAPKLIQTYYEKQTNTTYGEGYPLVSWIAMSLQSGEHSTGWYDNDYNLLLKAEAGEDMDAIKQQSLADIQTGLAEVMSSDGGIFRYCIEKIGTQWLEPTFMSIWATNGGGDIHPEPKNAFASMIYSDAFDVVFRFVMRFYIVFLYGGFAICAILLLRNRTDSQLILPLIILGGVLYHLIFEAQSRYTLSYLPLFAPLAAYGVLFFGVNSGKLFAKDKQKTAFNKAETANDEITPAAS